MIVLFLMFMFCLFIAMVYPFAASLLWLIRLLTGKAFRYRCGSLRRYQSVYR